HYPPGGTLSVPAPGLFALSSDPDGDTLTQATVTGAPSHGVVILQVQTGAFSYTPSAGFSGSDSFKYKVSDGLTLSNEATITLAPNHAPVANDDAFSTGEDQPLTVLAPGVLGND